MPNPFQDFTTLAKAQDCAGYELKLPLVVPEGYSNPVFRAIPGEFLEVVWTNDEGDDFRYRKCLASDGDASGDYNDYAVNKTVKVGNVDLLIRADAASEGERVHVISGVASDGYSYAMTSTQGLDTDQLLALRQGFIDEWLPVALHGESVETAQYLMDTFATRLYDTGISLLYRDDLNPSYFFYITLHEENGSRFVDSVSYLENGQVLLDQDTFTVSAASQSQDSNTTASLLEQSMTGNFVNRISQRS